MISGNKASRNYGLYDFWLVKVDANGNHLWDRSFGGSENDVLYAPLRSNWRAHPS
jgi:hypothetical protein